MVFDNEDVLDSIKQILDDGLEDRLTAIETEKIAKGKGIPDGLPMPEDSAFYLQTWSDDILNHSPAIFYGIEDNNSEGIGPATVQKLKIFVEAVITDDGSDEYGVKRLLRYTRAIRETFEKGFDSVANLGRIKIETVTPVSFKIGEDSSEEIRVGGVSLTIALA